MIVAKFTVMIINLIAVARMFSVFFFSVYQLLSNTFGNIIFKFFFFFYISSLLVAELSRAQSTRQLSTMGKKIYPS